MLDTYLAEIRVGNTKYSLEIYDTAGTSEDMDKIRQLVYPGTNVFIACYNVMHRESLHSVPRYYFPHISKSVPGAPIILVGNKLDLAFRSDTSSCYVDPEEAVVVAQRIGAVASLQCSALCYSLGTPSNVDRVFITAITAGLYNLFEEERKKEGSHSCCTSCRLV